MNKQDIKTRCQAKAEELLDKYFGHLPKEPDYMKPTELDPGYTASLPFSIEEEFWHFLDGLKAELAPEDQRPLEELLDRPLKRERIKDHYKEPVDKAYEDTSDVSFWEKLTVGNHEDVAHYLSLLEQYSRELLEHMTADFTELGSTL